MTLTKADLVQQLYKNHKDLTKAQATDTVEAFLRLSKDSLINLNSRHNYDDEPFINLE